MFYHNKIKIKNDNNFPSTKMEFSLNGIKLLKRICTPFYPEIILYHSFILNYIQTIISAPIVNKCYSMTTFFQKIIENVLNLVYNITLSLILKRNAHGGQGGNPLGHIYTYTK